MKKFIITILAGVLCISLASCGSNESVESSTKGTKSDPYKLGEEIKFTSCDYDENFFDVTLVLNSLTNEEQTEAEYLRRNSLDHSKQYLDINFIMKSEDGNFSDSISHKTDSEGGFMISAYTDSMTDTYFDYFTHDSGDFVNEFYTDINYDMYMIFHDENEYTKLSIEYRTGEYDTNTIWVELQ